MTWGSFSDDDRLLLSRAWDTVELGHKRRGAWMGFLNEHEYAYLRDNLPDDADIRFDGGYAGAQRVMLCAPAGADLPVTAIQLSYPDAYHLIHRDILGALMSLGLTRDSIGDILTEPGRAVFFCRREVDGFIRSQLTQVGRVGVKISSADIDDLPAGDAYDEHVLTVSSLRLDVFVSAVTGLSRDRSARLIRSDMVAVDHVIENSLSKLLREGSSITIRKYGKFVFAEDRGLSKKGKPRITVRHYR